jgi:hypothetical protein
MVAHVWAQQKQDDGRNAQRNIYFEGRTLYSYGSHFIVGAFCQNKHGKKAVLLNTNGYSSTTSRHKSDAVGAIRHDVPAFHVPYCSVDNNGNPHHHHLNKPHFHEVVKGFIAKAYAARSEAQYYVEQTEEATRKANDYSKFFGLRWRIKQHEFSQEFMIKALNARARAKSLKDARYAKDRAEYEKLAAERTKKATEDIGKWESGELEHISYANGIDCILRVRNDMVQTSQGATIPVTHARRIWPLIKRCHDRGSHFQSNGHSEHLGHFTVNYININGDMQIGCHFIKYNQFEKIAALIL